MRHGENDYLPLKKKCVSALLVLVVVLAIASYYMVRFRLPVLSPSPEPGNTTEPTQPSNSSNNQQTPPASSNPGSPIKIQPSPSGNSRQQPSSILKLGVYDGDPSGNQFNALSAIDWSIDGPIIPGQSRNSSRVYLRNEGNVPVTLYFSSQAWSFGDYIGNTPAQDYQQYFSLTWDYDNSALQVNQVRPVIFTLTIRPDIVDVVTFSFDLVVTLSY